MDHPAQQTWVKPAAPVAVAVLIPCYNEALTIGAVVSGFKTALPGAAVYVYDNNSTDETVAEARAAGALVFSETMQGKGNVVRRMFRDIEADFYLLVDGDGTYDPAAAPKMLDLARAQKIDLVNGVRVSAGADSYRFGHKFGNRVLTGMVNLIFGNRVQDMLSGYKLLSRRFVKSFPALSGGFDIETELTVHALELSLPVGHIAGTYQGRAEGSASKLNTYADGLRILWLIAVLVKHERPMQLFCAIAAVLTVAALSLATGLILDTVTRGRREARMLAYLQYGFHD